MAFTSGYAAFSLTSFWRAHCPLQPSCALWHSSTTFDVLFTLSSHFSVSEVLVKHRPYQSIQSKQMLTPSGWAWSPGETTAPNQGHCEWPYGLKRGSPTSWTGVSQLIAQTQPLFTGACFSTLWCSLAEYVHQLGCSSWRVYTLNVLYPAAWHWKLFWLGKTQWRQNTLCDEPRNWTMLNWPCEHSVSCCDWLMC